MKELYFDKVIREAIHFIGINEHLFYMGSIYNR